MAKRTSMDELLNRVVDLTPICLCAVAGGAVAFCLGLKRGHYRNNRYIAKAFLEMAGAAVTGLVLASSLPVALPRALVAFSIGVAWSAVVQTIRTRITAIVEGVLGNNSAEDGKK